MANKGKGRLHGRVAVVAGATRGAGRGIARALGEQGATVYCTGRSVKGKPSAYGRPETIEETAELVTAAGGRGIALRVDHTEEAEVRALFARVAKDEGRLDLLVNDLFSHQMDWKPFYEADLDQGFALMRQAVFSHVITARHAAPAMIARRRGLIVEIGDGDTLCYRGAFFYDLVKSTVIRLAFAMSEDLRRHRVAAVAVTPGFLRSEAMLDQFGVTEDTWRKGVRKDRHFVASETPLYVGRAVAALAADPLVFAQTGESLSSWELARRYGFTDEDGSRPDWGRHFAREVPERHFGQQWMRRGIAWQERLLKRARAYVPSGPSAAAPRAASPRP
ncbi:MAG: SDR family oxidoreductase [Vicinamibacteria bacterium]